MTALTMQRMSDSEVRPSFPQTRPSSAFAEASLNFGVAPWKSKAIARLDDLEQLEHDWDGYGSSAPEITLIDYVREMFRTLPYEFMPQPTIGPGSGGAIQVGWEKGKRGLELHFRRDFVVEFLKTEDNIDEESSLEQYDHDGTRRLVGWLMAG